MLSSQRNAIELESNIESSAWGRLEGYMEADTDVAQADFMHEPLVAFAGWVCSRGLDLNLVTY